MPPVPSSRWQEALMEDLARVGVASEREIETNELRVRKLGKDTKQTDKQKPSLESVTHGERPVPKKLLSECWQVNNGWQI